MNKINLIFSADQLHAFNEILFMFHQPIMKSIMQAELSSAHGKLAVTIVAELHLKVAQRALLCSNKNRIKLNLAQALALYQTFPFVPCNDNYSAALRSYVLQTIGPKI